MYIVFTSGFMLYLETLETTEKLAESERRFLLDFALNVYIYSIRFYKVLAEK